MQLKLMILNNYQFINVCRKTELKKNITQSHNYVITQHSLFEVEQFKDVFLHCEFAPVRSSLLHE